MGTATVGAAARRVAGRSRRIARFMQAERLPGLGEPEVTPGSAGGHAILDSYAVGPPSSQLAVDLFKGEWSSQFPPDAEVEAGTAPLFTDARIEWLLGTLDVRGRRVLELGPLEGAHSWMLDRAGADVVAVEGNSRAFLKCLIAKEVLGMDHVRFRHGDFLEYLTHDPERFDLVLASGVLYHMRDPLQLLDHLMLVSDRIALWTHYYDGDQLAAAGFGRQFARPPTHVRSRHGATYALHPRDYLEALQWGGFCGGPSDAANWMERDDLLDHLRRSGFNDIVIGFDEPDSQNGPSILLLATKADAGGA